jgi:broad specificity phosphatase PhoE
MIHKPHGATCGFFGASQSISNLSVLLSGKIGAKKFDVIFCSDLTRAVDSAKLALEVLLRGKTWEQAFAEDWRKAHAWQPGWEYTISNAQR